MVGFISSQTFSRGGGVQRRELGLRAGEQQRQVYCPTSGVLIDNFLLTARGQLLPSALRPLSLCKIARPLPRAFST